MKSDIVLACGGTGGHINPALAVAEVLKETGLNLALIVSGTRSAEAGVIQSWEGPLLKSGARPMKYFFHNIRAFFRCRRFLKKTRPAVLFATGGYTSFAPVAAARTLGIPVVFHEANSLVGEAVRMLSKVFSIDTVALTFDASKSQLPAKVKTVTTGLPLRRSVLEALARARQAKQASDTLRIFVTGGSQGAHGMNMLVAPVLASLAASDRKVTILHQCGANDVSAMEAIYAQVKEQVAVQAFVNDMGSAYGQADLVIARAGAATCFEIVACATPAIFIPLPTAKDDHQRKNAESIAQQGGAIVVNQTTATTQSFADVLRPIYQDRTLLVAMQAALQRMTLPDAATHVAQLLTAIVKRDSTK